MKRKVSFLLCFLMFASLNLANLAHGDVVNFPDPNLEAAIREALDKPEGPITDEDLAGLDKLDASERGIIDLTGIEYCINLQALYLHHNQITNISPLSGLISLQVLSLTFNKIENIEPLRDLANLEELGLGNNLIGDADSIRNLTNLRMLALNINQIRNIEPLRDLTNLQNLDLGGNDFSDLNPLAELTNLERLWLWVWGDQLSEPRDISPLSNLVNLRYLHLGGNELDDDDITHLENLSKLQMLYLYGNEVSNINPLANLTDMRVLHLDNNWIQDVSPLEGLTKIGEWEGWIEERDVGKVHLGLLNNQISDISPLLNNPGIGEGDVIDLRGNQLDIQKLQEKGATIILFDTPPFWRELHKPLAEQGYITEGLILDPLEDTAYNEEDIERDLLESVGGEAEVTPREGDILMFSSKEHRWKAYAFDIGNVFNWLFGEGANATTYVVTYLRFEEEGEVDMWVGSDDDISIWMNDQNVWLNAVLRGWEPDQDKFTAQVKAGWNRLLVKVNNRGGGGWGFSVRFPNVKPVEVSLNPDVMRQIGDVSGNGAITAYDAALILQFAVGIIDHLPAPTDVEVSSSPHPFKLRIPEVNAQLGDELRLPILVEDASGLFAGGLILRYDPSVLKAEDVLAGAMSSGTYWKASVEEEGIAKYTKEHEIHEISPAPLKIPPTPPFSKGGREDRIRPVCPVFVGMFHVHRTGPDSRDAASRDSTFSRFSRLFTSFVVNS